MSRKASNAAPEAQLHLLLSTVPDRESGEQIATALVNEGLAACVQLVPGLTSVFRWRGELAHSDELLLIAKTLRPEACLARLASLHPYETPEGVTVPVDQVLPGYLRWALESANEVPDSASPPAPKKTP